MAITVDQLSVGTPAHSNAAVGSITMTTNVDIAAGALAVFLVSWFHASVVLTTGSIGGHTCTVDQQQANGSDHIAIMSYYNNTGAVIAAGASATAIFSGTVTGGPAISGSSFLGIDTAATTDGKVGGTSNVWATGSFLTTNADDLLFAVAMTDGATSSSTATSPAIEATDFNDATANTTWTSAYRIVAATGTYSLAGGWAAAGTAGATALVAYKAAPGGATPAGPRPPVKPLMLALKMFRPLSNPFPFLFPLPSIDYPTTLVFTDSGTGTITLSGSGTESHTHSNTASGTITLSGSFTQSHTHSNSAAGSITLSGSGTQSHTHSNTASGTITLSGTGVQSFSHSGSASGTVTLSGSFTQSYTHSGSAAGTVTLSGSGVHSATFANTAAGTVTLSGSFTQSWSVSESRTGTITLGGTGTENYQPPGGVTYRFVSNAFLVALRRRGLL